MKTSQVVPISPLQGPVLAIETATPTARVALLDGASGEGRAAAEAVSERHSSNLVRLCAEVMAGAGITLAEVAAIACGAGPGSFTGLRVGLSVAKGLALPTGIPLVLVSSLEALAVDMVAAGAPLAPGSVLCPCLDAGKGEIYACVYDPPVPGAAPVPRGGPWTVKPDALASLLPAGAVVVLGGPGVRRHRSVLDAPGAIDRSRLLEVSGPTAESVGRLALARLGRGETNDLATAVPFYGRPPDITQPKPR
jgi:tRNA threonylcarbamoyladenosine biosynthesis protein TsaB